MTVSGHGDAKRVHVGEVRQAELARRVRLSKVHLPIGTMACPQVTDAAFEPAPDVRVQFAMALLQILQHGNRPQIRAGLQHRHHHVFEDSGQRIGSPASPRLL